MINNSVRNWLLNKVIAILIAALCLVDPITAGTIGLVLGLIIGAFAGNIFAGGVIGLVAGIVVGLASMFWGNPHKTKE